MATQTTNFNLTKPEVNDYVDASVLANNFDLIDTAIFEAGNNPELEGNVAGLVEKIGNTTDAGGSNTTGSVMGKVNHVINSLKSPTLTYWEKLEVVKKTVELNPVPYKSEEAASAVVGTDIYFFGGETADVQNVAYKYNTLTDQYTKLSNLPYLSRKSNAIAVGNDIYIFGGVNDAKNKACKYNVVTDSYTILTDIPSTMYNGAISAIGKDIYLFGGYDGTNYNLVYKYNIDNNQYLKLSNSPKDIRMGGAVVINGYIYLYCGGTSGSIFAFKYNSLDDSYTPLPNLPYRYYCGKVLNIGNNIYILGGLGSTGEGKFAYLYNIISNEYTKLPDLPYIFYDNVAEAVEKNIYVFANAGVNAYKYFPYKGHGKVYLEPCIIKTDYNIEKDGIVLEKINDEIIVNASGLYEIIDDFNSNSLGGSYLTIYNKR